MGRAIVDYSPWLRTIDKSRLLGGRHAKKDDSVVGAWVMGG